MNLIKWVKEHKIWSAIITIALFLLPIMIVHNLFKITAPCKWLNANWTAGEVLGYCGDVVGAAATITAIVLTIIFTQDNQKGERKLSIKPHLQTDYQPVFDWEKIIGQVDNRAVFVVYPHDETERISSSNEPPYLLRKSDKKEPTREIIKALDCSRRCYIIQYNVANVGAGNAVNLSFTIDDKPVIQPFSLTVSDTKVFIILLKAELVKDKARSIYFKYEYQDVASMARYEQHETIVLLQEDNGSLNSSQQLNGVISQPKEILEGSSK